MQCFFQGLWGGELDFPPKTITKFVCFLDVFHFFSPHKSNSPPQTTFLEKTLLLCHALGNIHLGKSAPCMVCTILTFSSNPV